MSLAREAGATAAVHGVQVPLPRRSAPGQADDRRRQPWADPQLPSDVRRLHRHDAASGTPQKALSGGGIIMDNGPHAFDLIRYLFGEVTSIAAQTSSVQHLEVEDTAKVDLVAGGRSGRDERPELVGADAGALLSGNLRRGRVGLARRRGNLLPVQDLERVEARPQSAGCQRCVRAADRLLRRRRFAGRTRWAWATAKASPLNVSSKRRMSRFDSDGGSTWLNQLLMPCRGDR